MTIVVFCNKIPQIRYSQLQDGYGIRESWNENYTRPIMYRYNQTKSGKPAKNFSVLLESLKPAANPSNPRFHPNKQIMRKVHSGLLFFTPLSFPGENTEISHQNDALGSWMRNYSSLILRCQSVSLKNFCCQRNNASEMCTLCDATLLRSLVILDPFSSFRWVLGGGVVRKTLRWFSTIKLLGGWTMGVEVMHTPKIRTNDKNRVD